MTIYSQRSSQPAARYTYSVPQKVRLRMMHTLRQHSSWPHNDFGAMLDEVRELAYAKYGGLRASPYEAARSSDHPAIEHFTSCSDDVALDFIEMCFSTRSLGMGSAAEEAADAVNRIFEEEGIGYELTAPKWRDTGKPATLFNHPTGTNVLEFEAPRIVKKGERTVHDLAVKPALEVLKDARLAVANTELLKAFEEVRKGDYADAITSCGSAFESVLRTICDFKGWSYDPNKDTCSSLVEICRSQGLFPPMYTEIFKSVGTLRNKLGDAHGKGPTPAHVAGREHAEHMIAVTCAHIDFVVHQARF
jgi:hypothetical protein